MKVKILQSMSSEGLEAPINSTLEALEVSGYEITDIKIQSNKNVWVALIIYKDNKETMPKEDELIKAYKEFTFGRLSKDDFLRTLSNLLVKEENNEG